MTNLQIASLPIGSFEECDIDHYVTPVSTHQRVPVFYGSTEVGFICLGVTQFANRGEFSGVLINSVPDAVDPGISESVYFPWQRRQGTLLPGYRSAAKPIANASAFGRSWTRAMPEADTVLSAFAVPMETTPLATSVEEPEFRRVFVSGQFDRAPWVDRFFGRIRPLFDLEEGWNGPRTMPLSVDAVSSAYGFVTALMQKFHQLPLPSVVPLNSGGLQIEWHRGGMDVEVEFEPDSDPALYVHDLLTGQEWEGDLWNLPATAIDGFRRLAI